MSAIFAWLADVGNSKIWRVMPNMRGVGQRIRPCRGPLAARSRPHTFAIKKCFRFLYMVRSTLTIWKFAYQPKARFRGSAANMSNKVAFLKIRILNDQITRWGAGYPFYLHQASISWSQTWKPLRFSRSTPATFDNSRIRFFQKHENCRKCFFF